MDRHGADYAHRNAQVDPAAEDPRVILAVERTFLAWVRTGIAFMGFGFVIARFGLFLQEMTGIGVVAPKRPPLHSIALGVLLVVAGVLVEIVAALRYWGGLRALETGDFRRRYSTAAPLAGALVLAVAGLIIAVYLLGI